MWVNRGGGLTKQPLQGNQGERQQWDSVSQSPHHSWLFKWHEPWSRGTVCWWSSCEREREREETWFNQGLERVSVFKQISFVPSAYTASQRQGHREGMDFHSLETRERERNKEKVPTEATYLRRLARHLTSLSAVSDLHLKIIKK